VAAFLVSPFGAAERTWKPFNPLLGETFELEGLGSNVRFMAEQVRHGWGSCWHMGKGWSAMSAALSCNIRMHC
jgi:hypothetical protein